MIRIDCRGVPTDDLAASEQIRTAADCFTRHGYAILDNVVAKEKIERLHREFLDSYSRFLKDEETDEVRQVGYQRYMLSLKLDGGFADLPVEQRLCAPRSSRRAGSVLARRSRISATRR
jgi:hypothetical protein